MKYPDLLSLLKWMVDSKFKPPQLVSCPSCGANLEYLSTVYRLGCQDCYKQFHKELVPMLQKLHGCAKHVGKRPKHHISLKECEKQMAEAIAKEDYETAAKLKQQIECLKANPQQES